MIKMIKYTTEIEGQDVNFPNFADRLPLMIE
jgi:hypothetical protein